MSTEPRIDLATAPTGPFSPTEVHARLARMRGRWEGTARTYFDPARPDHAEVARWSGTIEPVLGGRFLRFTYASSAMGQPIAGELTIAHEPGDRRVRMSWIDSLHTSPAILVSEGEPPPEAGPISAHGTYFAGAGEPRWGWRTELDDATPDALRIRMINIAPGGGASESVGVEIELARVT